MSFVRLIVLVLFYFLGWQAIAQTSVTAIALFEGRAMLSVDGQKAKIISAGQTFKGVSLISSNTNEAVIDLNGEREILELHGSATITEQIGGFRQGSEAVVEIRVDPNGFFKSSGTINGRRIEFLVDTGASLVVLNSVQANAIGLSYLQGEVGYASTASGTAPMYNLKLKSISLGGIILNDVEAGVIEGNYPEIPLLGMTFLSKVDMSRSGNLMTLKN